MIKRIGFDARNVPAQGGAGVAHVSRELLAALKVAAPECHVEILEFHSRQDFLNSVDAVIFPSGAVPLWFRGAAYPLVHDLFIFDHPEWFDQRLLKRAFTTKSFLFGLRRAERIFAVSEATKKDIVRHAGVSEEKIDVVYQGAGIPKNFAHEKQIQEQFFLALGTVEPRKNLNLLFELVSRNDFPDGFRLVIAGKAGWGNVVVPNDPKIEYLEGVSDAKKWELLRDARALLLPSFAEGFGRGALEAMSVGTPVIASDTTAIPEVVGDAGILLPTDDADAWANAINRIATDEDLYLDLGKKGYTQSMKFLWKKTADSMLATIIGTC